jgi:preprotein translocase subunit SecA
LYTSDSHFAEEWDLTEIFTALNNYYPVTFGPDDITDLEELTAEEFADRVVADALEAYRAKELDVGEEHMRALERWVLLRTSDGRWRDHLYEMDYLREGIGLRALAQKDPLVEYKSEAFDMFQTMLEGIQQDFVRLIYRLEVVKELQTPREQELAYSASDETAAGGAFDASGIAAGGARIVDGSAAAYQAAQSATKTVTAPRHVEKVGRNDPCPCGSGKKYKKCHGAAA